ncbi:hypothetical protein Q8W71_14790 [Methylobacterium sp. NEAU 140]|uniref:hypothetical protein n=1 Tax=Methylobacterium sp. NEAU 140 TaxID=3064945 RepID=UPI002732C555|nr:hypothetical protein [Methylobacterium sp. NEAU 140]MDP4023896.1 hypothetical protein [Methylobacterium sp. NEAU 140]
MARPVNCHVIDRPDGRFDVVAIIRPRRIFRRQGLMTRAEAEACIDDVRTLMSVFGAPVVQDSPPTGRTPELG